MQSSSLCCVNESDLYLCVNRFILFYFYWLICVGIEHRAHPSKSTVKKSEQQTRAEQQSWKVLATVNWQMTLVIKKIFCVLFSLCCFVSQHWSRDEIHLVLVNRIAQKFTLSDISNSAVTF